MACGLLKSGYAESNAASARERGSPRFEGSDCFPRPPHTWRHSPWGAHRGKEFASPIQPPIGRIWDC